VSDFGKVDEFAKQKNESPENIKVQEKAKENPENQVEVQNEEVFDLENVAKEAAEQKSHEKKEKNEEPKASPNPEEKFEIPDLL